MALAQINARDLVIEVQVSNGTTPVWAEIGGLLTATPNPGENEETSDNTTFESQGHYEQEVMQRGATLSLEGRQLKDDTTGEPDPGQARCEELGAAVGRASLGKIRFRHPVDTEWKVWTCTATLGEQGGGHNDKSAWGVTFTRSGASTTEAVV